MDNELDECNMRPGPKEIYTKLARDAQYLPYMPIIEIFDNSIDYGSNNIWATISNDIYRHQDDGISFINYELEPGESLEEIELSKIKTDLCSKVNPLKDRGVYDNISNGYNNWGLKGAFGYHRSKGTIYSWNNSLFCCIVIDIPLQIRTNRFSEGLDIHIYEKDKIPTNIRRSFQRDLVYKDPITYEKNTGTLLIEEFTERKPNIIEDLNELGYDKIEINNGLWVENEIRKRYLWNKSTINIQFNGKKLKHINETILEEDNRMLTISGEVYKKDKYILFTKNKKVFEWKYNIESRVYEKYKKKEDIRYLEEQYKIADYKIIHLNYATLDNKMIKDKWEKLSKLYHPDYQQTNGIKIYLNNYMISDSETSYKTNETDYKEIITTLEIKQTNNQSMKKLLLDSHTITKQKGAGNSLFYKLIWSDRKDKFDKSINGYISWAHQLKHKWKIGLLRDDIGYKIYNFICKSRGDKISIDNWKIIDIDRKNEIFNKLVGKKYEQAIDCLKSEQYMKYTIYLENDDNDDVDDTLVSGVEYIERNNPIADIIDKTNDENTIKKIKKKVWDKQMNNKTDGTCPLCDCKIDLFGVYTDYACSHLQSRINDGDFSYENLIYLCKSCNSKMQGTNAYEWICEHHCVDKQNEFEELCNKLEKKIK